MKIKLKKNHNNKIKKQHLLQISLINIVTC